MKESSDASRRSSSLKVKEKDKMQYNKPSTSTRINHRGGGSFITPSNTSGKQERTRKSKLSSSACHIKANYSKSNGASNNTGSSTNGQYIIGSNYGNKNSGPNNKNPGRSNFTANPRIRKTANSGTSIHNTMASFRSGPVKVVGESNNAPRESQTSAQGRASGKDVSKRPLSASKATKKPLKMHSKPSNRPGTASTRTSSNRPPSPGTRSLKSDLLFGSYNKKNNTKSTGISKNKFGNSKQGSSFGKIKQGSTSGVKTRTKPQSPGRAMYPKHISNASNNTYTQYKGLRAPPHGSNN